MQKETPASGGAFAAGFAVALVVIGAQETEGEAADDRPVPGAVATTGARQIVLELDIEQPVHAQDAAMAAHGSNACGSSQIAWPGDRGASAHVTIKTA